MVEPPDTPRARARAARIEEIKAIARRHVAEHGSDGLSLRAVAREMGVVSSAVYRYVESRDALLTALIVDAFDTVGGVAEAAVAEAGDGLADQWRQLAWAIRRWAFANPADYALVYGTPVPGYQAPQDTVGPAARVSLVALGVARDALAAGEIRLGAPAEAAAAVRRDFAHLRQQTGMDLPDELISRLLLVWTQLFGGVSYELFGHLHRVIDDGEAFFAHQLDRSIAILVGERREF